MNNFKIWNNLLLDSNFTSENLEDYTHITGWNLKYAEIVALAKALESNSSITTLYLGDNDTKHFILKQNIHTLLERNKAKQALSTALQELKEKFDPKEIDDIEFLKKLSLC